MKRQRPHQFTPMIRKLYFMTEKKNKLVFTI